GGDVHRGSILLPDTTGEYLKVWVHHQMPATSVARTVLYIGPDDNRRKREQGVAGEAFIKQEIIIAHLKKENEQYRFDKKSYIEFDGQRVFPPYSSFVCVPIIGLATNSSTLN